MRFDVITLFPSTFSGFLDSSLIARAIAKKIIKVQLYDLHDFATDRHLSVDDRPYGGGPGMVLRVDVLDRAITKIKSLKTKTKTKLDRSMVVLLSPRGKGLDQAVVSNLAKLDRLILVAGHYEGFDERVHSLVDQEFSIGDFVLSGGELPAMVVIESVSRLVPGFLGKADSVQEESFSLIDERTKWRERLLEYPQYTRPPVFRGQKVPEVLLSGDHARVKKWRLDAARKLTQARRPDLLISK